MAVAAYVVATTSLSSAEVAVFLVLVLVLVLVLALDVVALVVALADPFPPPMTHDENDDENDDDVGIEDDIQATREVACGRASGGEGAPKLDAF